MTLKEAYEILEIEPSNVRDFLKLQFRWFVKFYHPDNPSTGNVEEFRRVLQAYETISKDLEV